MLKQEEKQVIVMSKGIGFKKSKGDLVDMDALSLKKDLFIFENQSGCDINQFKKDFSQIEYVTQILVHLAKEKLHAQDEVLKTLHNALLDHITFSVQRLRVDMSIENPFIKEILILCKDEFDIARIAAQEIHKRLGIKIGEDEMGFIALHLYYGKEKCPAKNGIKSVRIYKQAVELINNTYDIKIDENETICKSFLLSLSKMLYSKSNKQSLSMPFYLEVKEMMPKAYQVALEISNMINETFCYPLDDEMIAYLAIDIHRLVQL